MMKKSGSKHPVSKKNNINTKSGSLAVTSKNNVIKSSPRSPKKAQNKKQPLCVMTKIMSLSEFNSCNFIEWVEYHLLMGVSHFYVNDECSPEPLFSQALDHYRQLGVLTVTAASLTRNCTDYKPNETNLMRSTFQNYSKNCEWVSLIDMDEFITLLPVQSESLLDLLAHSRFPFVRMPWWSIGSDGHEKRPQGLMIENYRRGGLQIHHLKTISKTSEVWQW